MILCRVPAGRAPQFYELDDFEFDLSGRTPHVVADLKNRAPKLLLSRVLCPRRARSWFTRDVSGAIGVGIADTAEEARARALVALHGEEDG